MSYVFLTLLSLAFVVIECLAGGTLLLYSLPVYALLALAALLAVFSIRAVKIMPKPACLVSAMVFTGYILARCCTSPVDYLARRDTMMVLGCLVVYLLTALHLVKSKYRMQFIGLLLAIALGQLAVGMIQFTSHTESAYMLFGLQRPLNGSRASGQYISPNHLAGFLEVVGIMGLSLVFWSTWKPLAKILTGYVSLLALAGVMFTGSRGGYVSTVFCILVFCALGITVIKIAYPERLVRVVLVGGAVILLVAGSLPFVITSSLVKARSSQIMEKNMRLKMWQAAWQQVKINPLLGTGSGSYLYYGRKYRDPDVQDDPVRVHNDYLDLLAEYGIVGVACFLFFFVAHLQNGLHTFFWLVRKRLQFSADWRSSSLALNIGCLCAVAAYVVHSVVDFNLHIPANAILMAFVFGILANPGLETSHESRLAVQTSRIFQFLLPVLGVVILAVGLPEIPGEYYTEKARVALRDEKYPDAILAAKAGIAWEKKNPDLFYYLGEAERSMGDKFPSPALARSFYLAASDAFKKGLEVFPQDVRLYLVEGWTLDALGQTGEAGSYFDKAMEWDPHSNEVMESVSGHVGLTKGAAAQDTSP